LRVARHFGNMSWRVEYRRYATVGTDAEMAPDANVLLALSHRQFTADQWARLASPILLEALRCTRGKVLVYVPDLITRYSVAGVRQRDPDDQAVIAQASREFAPCREAFVRAVADLQKRDPPLARRVAVAHGDAYAALNPLSARIATALQQVYDLAAPAGAGVEGTGATPASTRACGDAQVPASSGTAAQVAEAEAGCGGDAQKQDGDADEHYGGDTRKQDGVGPSQKEDTAGDERETGRRFWTEARLRAFTAASDACAVSYMLRRRRRHDLGSGRSQLMLYRFRQYLFAELPELSIGPTIAGVHYGVLMHPVSAGTAGRDDLARSDSSLAVLSSLVARAFRAPQILKLNMVVHENVRVAPPAPAEAKSAPVPFREQALATAPRWRQALPWIAALALLLALWRARRALRALSGRGTLTGAAAAAVAVAAAAIGAARFVFRRFRSTPEATRESRP
jgi:hypothetical protein